MFRTCNAFNDQHAPCWMILLLSIFSLNLFCSTLVIDHRDILPNLKWYVFFVWTEIWFCEHSLAWRTVWTPWGFFFLFICSSVYRFKARLCFSYYLCHHTGMIWWTTGQLQTNLRNLNEFHVIFFFIMFSLRYLNLLN